MRLSTPLAAAPRAATPLAALSLALVACGPPVEFAPGFYAENLPIAVVDARYDDDDNSLHVLYGEGGQLHLGRVLVRGGGRQVVSDGALSLDGAELEGPTYGTAWSGWAVLPRPGSPEIWIYAAGALYRVDDGELVLTHTVPNVDERYLGPSWGAWVTNDLVAVATHNTTGVAWSQVLDVSSDPPAVERESFLGGGCGVDAADGVLYSRACSGNPRLSTTNLAYDDDLAESAFELPGDHTFVSQYVGSDAAPLAVADGLGLVSGGNPGDFYVAVGERARDGSVGLVGRWPSTEYGLVDTFAYWAPMPARADLRSDGNQVFTVHRGFSIDLYDRNAPPGTTTSFAGSWCKINGMGTTRIELPVSGAPELGQAYGHDAVAWSNTGTRLIITSQDLTFPDDPNDVWHHHAFRVGDTLHVKGPINRDTDDLWPFDSLVGLYTPCAD